MPDRIRTCDLRFRRALFYPAELRAHITIVSIIAQDIQDVKRYNDEASGGDKVPETASLRADTGDRGNCSVYVGSAVCGSTIRMIIPIIPITILIITPFLSLAD